MAIQLNAIDSEDDYRAALREIDQLMDARPHTPRGDRLDGLTTLVEAWEERHHAIEAPDPVA